MGLVAKKKAPARDGAFKKSFHTFYNLFLSEKVCAQLERDLIADRVRNGLANAKAKGIRIGRLKTRDTDLIRKLKARGMTYRQIAKIAGCSPGAVGAEVRAMKAEKVILEEEMAIKQEQAISKNQDIQFELIRF